MEEALGLTKKIRLPDLTQPSASFDVTLEELNELNESRDKEVLGKHGGVQGIAAALQTSPVRGLDTQTAHADQTLQGRQRVFGANKFKEVQQKAFFQLVFENLQDPILILLILAALVSTILGAVIAEARRQAEWTEGVAIWIAVAVVSLVGAGNDYQKDIQFRKLNAKKDELQIKVVRDAKEVLIPNTDLVVGDLVLLVTGDKIVADGLCVESHGLVADEASLTGESDPLKKGPEDPFCRAGTQVSEGSGSMVVIAVGLNSEYGKTMSLVMTEAEDTPLQETLAVLAAAIGKAGLFVAVVCFCVLLIRWCVANQGFPVDKIVTGPLAFFIFGVTIVVVAVPEGLPLAVTISLAYSMKKMMKDNNFVRVMAACETMGGATAICSDKTGTLTENRMTVVEGWFAGTKYSKPPTMADLPEKAQDVISNNISVNSSAFLVLHEGKPSEPVGNRTECALLQLLTNWGPSYKTIREEHRSRIHKLYGFSSAQKMASVLIKSSDGFRLHNKGAAEMVLARCTSVLDTSGNAVELTGERRSQLEETITEMASRGLRTLCLSYRDISAAQAAEFGSFEDPPNSELVCCCICGIKDPVRLEVPDAVATCKRAGIFVRMVTGDNINTARFIARECGIFTDGIALEGPAFRKMSEEELIPLLPKLQVLARSSPTDKYMLVKLLKKQGEVVAVTGDGTNDAPALKESHVGLAMGIAGTEVAKEAADIVIMDDNFSSIVKSVLWGRSVFANLRKFLQFQLTVNFVALVIAFVAAITNGETPLNVIQLLWVNLIMDALGALALATESPTPDLLTVPPNGQSESIINTRMWKHILTQGCYQLFWLFLIIYGAPARISRYHVTTECQTMTMLHTDKYAGSTSINLSNVTTTPPYRSLDLCCSGTDCYEGGLYYQGEVPLCQLTGRRRTNQYQYDVDESQKKYNSMVFNAFIFMQVFNQLNSRKIKDEYNVFDGLVESRSFIYISVVEVVLQLIIMLTPISQFFKVDYQTWYEWLIAIALGVGALLWAFIVKLVSR
eukprot:jgi/Astpho2/4702/fgenesh1_pg.00067_%23_185_t